MSFTSLGGKAAPVRFERVSKTFGKDVVAVNDIDLEINAGRLVTLLGPSGCGKTTTLRLIAGLEIATSGRILIGDQDVTKLPATDRDVSMVFQSYALFPHMSVIENVMYGLTFSGYAKDEARDRARSGLELVGLEGFETRLPSELSGGQQQRVAVARALVLEPQVLLFDEPLSNLDAKLRRRVRDDIRAIQRDLGLTVVYVTHDQEEALAVSDEIIVMRNAEIAQVGHPRELYESPNNCFVADFIGEANLIPCQIVDIQRDNATIEIEGYRYRLPSRGLPKGPAMLVVRPSQICIGGAEGIPACIAKTTYVGVRMEYTLEGAFGQVFAVQADVSRPHRVGDEMHISFLDPGPVLLSADDESGR